MLGVLRRILRAQRGGALDDEPRPSGLDVADVLDQAAEAQRADRGSRRRLLVGEAAQGAAQEVAVARQGGEQVRGLVLGHRKVPSSSMGSTLESYKCQFLSSIGGRLENMAGTSSRALQLLSLLQTHRYWAGAELAARLEVSLRTLRRDVDRLRELGYPVEAQRGVDGGYQLAPGASLPPLVLDDEEAVALAVGLMAAAQSSVAGTAESSMRALAKVVQVMPARLRRQAEALQAMIDPMPGRAMQSSVDPQALTAIAQACRDSERLRFSYTAAGGAGARAPRRTAPDGLARVPLVSRRLRPRSPRLAHVSPRSAPRRRTHRSPLRAPYPART